MLNRKNSTILHDNRKLANQAKDFSISVRKCDENREFSATKRWHPTLKRTDRIVAIEMNRRIFKDEIGNESNLFDSTLFLDRRQSAMTKVGTVL